MAIMKSEGTTNTERLLAKLCERSFLKLWSYPNPFKDDGNEFCDLLAVFENHVFIFFDRENRQLHDLDKDPHVQWKRWKRRVIDSQVDTAHGAEKYIRSGRKIFLDSKRHVEFPVPISRKALIVHKIVIAHGAMEACQKASASNVYGSLGVAYGIPNCGEFPFMVDIDRENPVHVFDSHNLPIVLDELDTVFDLSTYLDAKLEAIKQVRALVYCGEEDLLAHYLRNYDKEKNKHFIGVAGADYDFFAVGEGEWNGFISSDLYARKKKADKVSYFWDELIQKTCQNALDGTLLGRFSTAPGESALHEMAKEPRFWRRALSQRMIDSMRKFPETSEPITTNLSFMPSFHKDKAYIFLQMKMLDIQDYENDYRPKRRMLLEIACGVAKNKFPNLKQVIGIAVDAPKYSKGNSEDFLLLNCSTWSEADRAHYDEANREIKFFRSYPGSGEILKVTEFPLPEAEIRPSRKKTGKNEPCPCGSGLKFKKCCGKSA